MKKIILVVALIVSGFMAEKAAAQLHISFRANINTQPIWGPTGYDYVDYYYMPDIDVFYYVPSHQYIYQYRGHWRFSATLPYQYRNFDMYNGYKVVVNEPRPYQRADFYRNKYSSFRGQRGGETIRDSHDSKYFGNKHHPEHDKWKKDHDQQNKKGNRSRHH